MDETDRIGNVTNHQPTLNILSYLKNEKSLMNKCTQMNPIKAKSFEQQSQIWGFIEFLCRPH